MCPSRIYFNRYNETSSRELEYLPKFIILGRNLNNLRYTVDSVDGSH